MTREPTNARCALKGTYECSTYIFCLSMARYEYCMAYYLLLYALTSRVYLSRESTCMHTHSILRVLDQPATIEANGSKKHPRRNSSSAFGRQPLI